MGKLDAHKVALAVSGTAVAVHVVWLLLILLSWAQPFINFVQAIHFIRPMYQVTPFDIGTAILLLVVVAIVGYCVGFAFATIANKVRS